MKEETKENYNKIIESFEKHDVTSLVDWLEKLDKRVSDI